METLTFQEAFPLHSLAWPAWKSSTCVSNNLVCGRCPQYSLSQSLIRTSVQLWFFYFQFSDENDHSGSLPVLPSSLQLCRLCKWAPVTFVLSACKMWLMPTPCYNEQMEIDWREAFQRRLEIWETCIFCRCVSPGLYIVTKMFWCTYIDWWSCVCFPWLILWSDANPTLTGSIPASIASMTTLVELYLSR